MPVDVGIAAIDVDINNADITILIEIENYSDDVPAKNVEVRFKLPDSIVFQSVVTEGLCEITAEQTVCSYDLIESNTTVSATFFYQKELQGEIRETVVVTSADTDANTRNNEAVILIPDNRNTIVSDAEPGFSSEGGGSISALGLFVILAMFIVRRQILK